MSQSKVVSPSCHQPTPARASLLDVCVYVLAHTACWTPVPMWGKHRSTGGVIWPCVWAGRAFPGACEWVAVIFSPFRT